ncbi:MAG: hypothetical protein J7L82_07095, partial [Staphylothermus sp.]|nr:hypothetical protein [Staphylothermus sp.]
MTNYGKQLWILVLLITLLVGIIAFYVGFHGGKTSIQTNTSIPATSTTITKSYNPYIENIKETIQNYTRIAVYHDKVIFDDLMTNKYYIFNQNGAKLY